jgi:hypothetical protein
MPHATAHLAVAGGARWCWHWCQNGGLQVRGFMGMTYLSQCGRLVVRPLGHVGDVFTLPGPDGVESDQGTIASCALGHAL